MDFKRFFKHFISFGAIYYTIISVVFITIAAMLTEKGSMLLEPSRFLSILLFAFIMGLGSALIRSPEIPYVGAACAHVGCFIGGFLIFMAICGYDFTRIMIATLIFAVIYAIVTLIVNAIKKAANKKKNAKETKPKTNNESKKTKEAYKSQFTK